MFRLQCFWVFGSVLRFPFSIFSLSIPHLHTFPFFLNPRTARPEREIQFKNFRNGGSHLIALILFASLRLSLFSVVSALCDRIFSLFSLSRSLSSSVLVFSSSLSFVLSFYLTFFFFFFSFAFLSSPFSLSSPTVPARCCLRQLTDGYPSLLLSSLLILLLPSSFPLSVWSGSITALSYHGGLRYHGYALLGQSLIARQSPRCRLSQLRPRYGSS